MQKGNLDDLRAFVAVAREHSFTKAAAKLAVSQPALSHTIRQLEARLGVRLLTRTTRSVSLTDAGERLSRTVEPRFQEIDAELAAVSALRGKPSGTIRITAGDHAVRTVLWPKLQKFLPEYPDIRVEIDIDHGLTDIVAGRYDAGVRWGEQVAKDMIAVRIGSDIRFAVIGAKSYFSRRPPPKHPQELVSQECINIRLPSYGGNYAWEFQRNGREMKVRVDGQLAFNSIYQVLDAAVAGFDLAYVPEDLAQPYLAKGRVVQVLEQWCEPRSGYHLYYRAAASRRRRSLSLSTPCVTRSEATWFKASTGVALTLAQRMTKPPSTEIDWPVT